MAKSKLPRSKQTRQRDLVSSLGRGFLVLRAFDQNSIEMTPADVARKTAIPRAATRRILLTLYELGYAVTDGKFYRLTPKVLDLAHGFLAKTRVRDLIDPIIREATQAMNESCTFAIRDGDDFVNLACSNAAAFGAVSVTVGQRFPLYIGAPGRLLLTALTPAELKTYLAPLRMKALTPKAITDKAVLRQELDHIRERGYAIGREEIELGVYGISVPVVNSSGITIGSLSCLGNVARIQSEQTVKERLVILRRAAARISAIIPDSFDPTSDLASLPRG